MDGCGREGWSCDERHGSIFKGSVVGWLRGQLGRMMRMWKMKTCERDIAGGEEEKCIIFCNGICTRVAKDHISESRRWITWCRLFRDLRGRYWPDFCQLFVGVCANHSLRVFFVCIARLQYSAILRCTCSGIILCDGLSDTRYGIYF